MLEALEKEMADNNWTTANEWNSLGAKYHKNAKEGHPQDYLKARMCYKKAIELDKNYPLANYNLGLIYQNSLEVDEDIPRAKNYYQVAASQGDSDAQKKLLAIETKEYKELLASLEIEIAKNKENTADHWNSLGVKYHRGEEGRPQNDVKARICYEKALKLESNHPYANYNMAEACYRGDGLNKDIKRAKIHYQKFTSQEDEEYEYVQKKILEIEMEEHHWTTADDWYLLGEKYRTATDGRPQDFLKARICYEKAVTLKQNHPLANYWLGWMHDHEKGINKKTLTTHDIARTVIFFTAGVVGKIVEEVSTTAAAVVYNSYTPSRVKNTSTAYDMPPPKGMLDAAGKGTVIPSDLRFHPSYHREKAKTCYMRSAQGGHDEAQLRLSELEVAENNLTTASEWNALGVNYYKAANGHLKARLCFEKALTLQPDHAEANYNVGQIYYHELGAKKDIQKARVHFRNAMAKDDKDAYRQLRNLEKEEIERLAQTGNLNEKDSNGDTALHRMAKQGFYKYYARLQYMGADVNALNTEGKEPIYYLKTAPGGNAEKKTQKLLIDFVETIKNYYSSIPAAIVSNISSVGPMRLDEDLTKQRIAEMYQHPYIKPLLNLIKFARYGQHDLSQQKHFGDAGYISDNDDNLPTDTSTYFRILLDPNSATIESIFVGDGGKECWGIYQPGSNNIKLGTQGNKKEVCKTLLHEMTHFIAHEVFKNAALPYLEDDAKAKSDFTTIASDLGKNQGNLPPIIQDAFSSSYKKDNQIQQELIVRVVELYYECGGDENDKRIKTVSALWNYYVTVFLPAVEKHVQKLGSRMLSGWSPNLFPHHPHVTHSLKVKNEDKDKNDEIGPEVSPQLLSHSPSNQNLLTPITPHTKGIKEAPSSFLSPQSFFVAKSVSSKADVGGDDAFHAVLGQWNGKKFVCQDVPTHRAAVQQAILESDDDPVLSKLVISGIKELIISGQAAGPHSAQLKEKYQQFLEKKQGEWNKFEAVLKDNSTIANYVHTHHQLKNPKASFRDQFYDALNRNEGELYRRILSIPPLHITFQAYNQACNKEFDWESTCSFTIIEEYAHFVGKLGQCLLATGLAIMAHVFKTQVDYTPYPGAKTEVFNAGKSQKVCVQWKGENHFERLIPPTIVPTQKKHVHPTMDCK